MRRWIVAALVMLSCGMISSGGSADPETSLRDKLQKRRLGEVVDSERGKAKLRQLADKRADRQHPPTSKTKPKPNAKAKTKPSAKANRQNEGRPQNAAADKPASASQTKPAPKQRTVVKDEPLTATEQALSQALQLRVDERGPRAPWKVTLTNVGPTPIRVYEDVRLLWFSVSTPTQKGGEKKEECRLPNGMVPSFAPDRHRVTLGSGTSLSFRIDPRFYCFDSQQPKVLLPNASVVAHYGWPEKTRKVWRAGKLTKVRLAQEAPYAFKPSPERDEGLREVAAPAFELDERYAAWQTPPRKIRGDVDPDAAFRLLMTRGADSTSGSVSVQVALENLTQVTQRVHFKRDHLTFIINGPDGTVRCEPEVWRDAPDSQNLTALGGGKRQELTIRLSEFCADPIFTRAGFYYVRAALPRPRTKAELSAYAEEAEPAIEERPVLRAVAPCLVRVQRSEQPFDHWVPTKLRVPASEAAPIPSRSKARADR